jgi:protein-S-isoprenylcysteine O-methyltransferase Ste14
MKATRFEYRFRFWIHALIYVLGFAAPWTYLAFWNSGSLGAQALNEPAWLEISTLLYRQGWLTYNAAVVALLIAALIFAGLGAWLRLLGTAYVDASIVQSNAMHAAGAGGGLLADGPYRRTRNPLYLGTLLHTIGISVLMPPSGAIFAIALLWVFQVRLALAEEPFLAARFGQPYLDYKNAVPRFLPAPTPQVASAGLAPRWGQALLGEIYFVGAFLTLAIFGWSFDRTALRRGILISLGVALIARAFVPRTPADPINAT